MYSLIYFNQGVIVILFLASIDQYFPQNKQFNFSFQTDTEITGVLFLLSIRPTVHVVLFHCIVFAKELSS